MIEVGRHNTRCRASRCTRTTIHRELQRYAHQGVPLPLGHQVSLHTVFRDTDSIKHTDSPSRTSSLANGMMEGSTALHRAQAEHCVDAFII
jgi:hypothetical protein